MSLSKQTYIEQDSGQRGAASQEVVSKFLSERLKGTPGNNGDAIDPFGYRLPSHLIPQVTEISIDELDGNGRSAVRNSTSGSSSLSSVTFQSADNLGGRLSSSCCPCVGCTCSCHLDGGYSYAECDRPIDSYVAYLFDYELFNVPQNLQKYEVLLDYLREERIFDRSYVVSISTDTQRDNYTMSGAGGGRNTQSKLQRCEYDSNVLRYRPSIVESTDDTRNDIRHKFRGLIVQGGKYDWFTIRSTLHFPAFLVYVKLACSKNDIHADHTILVDTSNLNFISSQGTFGFKIARILAHTRSKYFGIPHFNFAPLIEQANVRALQRTAKSRSGHG